MYGASPESVLAQVSRYQQMMSLFARSFPRDRVSFFARAPGRVNLIGEHTDYNGYPVMPMALDRDAVFAIAPIETSTIELVNVDARFGRREFSTEFPVEPYEQGDWGNYVKAAVNELLAKGWVEKTHTKGFKAIVAGSIPESAGLSSSSAMVVVAALAFLASNNVKFDRKELADLLAHAERYVGSEGGGMDQAVSLLAEAGHALRIDFFPLRTESVPLREELTFVVCNSLIRAPKSESVRYAYNRRVVECRLATALIAKSLESKTAGKHTPLRLADLSAERVGMKPDELRSVALEAIGESPLSLKELAIRLDLSPEAVKQHYCMQQDGTPLEEPREGFKVWHRYRHVVTEALRVGKAVTALRDGDIAEIGALMNRSHASCRDDYEISCAELDELVSLGLESGALGARLTGAGFGGCTVHAVPTPKVANFVRDIELAYYKSYVGGHGTRPFSSYSRLSDVLFLCRATEGAGFWPIE